MGNPYLQMFKDVVNEVGTEIVPIDFGFCNAGETTDLGYDLLFYNDKDGSQNSEDVKEINVELLRMYLTEKFSGDGNPDQTSIISYPEVISDIYTEEEVKVEGTKWARINNFSSYPADAEVYLFDYTLGKATFGDGINGKKPIVGVDNIEITYTPDLNIFGKTVWEDKWLEIKSNGIITTEILIDLEQSTKINDNLIEVLHYPYVTEIVGVWDNPGKTGTDYYNDIPGHSFDGNTGQITLGGVGISVATVYVEYKYEGKSDNEGAYTALGNGIQKSLENRLPKQNAKKLQLRITLPETANSEGGVFIRIFLRAYYKF